jgi:hypothetical protein
MHLIDFETQLTAFLHPGSLVSCHNFFNSRSRPGRSLFNSDKGFYWSTTYMPKQ